MGICGGQKNTDPNSDKPGVVFVVGGPGSGKGTQCAKLVGKYGFIHLSTGDLLRAEVASGSEKGKELQTIMAKGGLVKTSDLLLLLEAAMRAKGWAKAKFLIDGFPRNTENVQTYGEVLMDKTNLLGILFFELDSETMRGRLLGRKEGRADDNEETIKKRLATYEEETVPVVTKMDTTNKNVFRVNSKLTIEEVFAATIIQVDKMLGYGKKAEVAPAKNAETKPDVVFVVGGPGSGKGTQCAKIVEKYGCKHLSTGDLLRAEVASGSEKGKALSAIMNEGGLVKTTDLLELVSAAMMKVAGGRFLLDGFPRNMENINTWDEVMGKKCNVLGCLYYNLDPETMKARLLGRNEGRADDNEDVINKRLATYENETMATVKYMAEEKKCVHEISSKQTIDEVFAATCVAVDAMHGAAKKEETITEKAPVVEEKKPASPGKAPVEDAPAPASPEKAPVEDAPAPVEDAPAPVEG
jgi:adenylate kinase